MRILMKITQKEAHYTPNTVSGRRCAGCAMFHPKDLICDLVRGIINPSGWCKHWTKKTEERG